MKFSGSAGWGVWLQWERRKDAAVVMQSGHERTRADGSDREGLLNTTNRICSLLFVCHLFSRYIVSTFPGLALGAVKNESDVVFSGIGFMVRV